MSTSTSHTRAPRGTGKTCSRSARSRDERVKQEAQKPTLEYFLKKMSEGKHCTISRKMIEESVYSRMISEDDWYQIDRAVNSIRVSQTGKPTQKARDHYREFKKSRNDINTRVVGLHVGESKTCL